MAEQICHAVAHHAFAISVGHTQPLQVTVSVGLAHCAAAPVAAEIDALIHNADVPALTKPSRMGRNRVVSMPYGQDAQHPRIAPRSAPPPCTRTALTTLRAGPLRRASPTGFAGRAGRISAGLAGLYADHPAADAASLVHLWRCQCTDAGPAGTYPFLAHHAQLCVHRAGQPAGWLVEGRSFSDALLWGTADAAGVATGVLLLARLPVPTVQSCAAKNSPLLCYWPVCAASAVTTLLRLPVQMPLLGSAWPKELALALSTEFMNHVLILPVVLTFHLYSHWHRLELRHTLPLVALLLSELLATLIGGPGAIAFTLPAFIRCALRYPLSATASIFALFTLWKCQAFAMGHSSMTSAYFSDMVSLRVGLSLLWRRDRGLLAKSAQ